MFGNRAYPVFGDRSHDSRRPVAATQAEVLYKIAEAHGENPVMHIVIGSAFDAAPAEQQPAPQALPEESLNAEA